MNKKYWEIIIEKSKKQQTLPYIIGSKKILFPNSELDTVESLIGDIIISETDKIYSMYFCGDIGEYVIYQNMHKNYLPEGLKIHNPKTGNLKLIFGMNMEILGKSFDKIKLKLAENYAINLDAKKYSFVNRKWTYFSEKEKKLILSFKN